MPDPVYTINIVAHRLFGSTYQSASDARVDRIAGILGAWSAGSLPRPMVVPEPDYDHGTTRSEADVQALFSRDPAYHYPRDLTLNDIFEPLSVRFELLRVVENCEASDPEARGKHRHRARLGDILVHGVPLDLRPC